MAERIPHSGPRCRLVSAGGVAPVLTADIGFADQVDDVIEATADEFEGADILVNNARII